MVPTNLSAASDASVSDTSKASCYEIRVKGQIDSRWADWFDGMAIIPAEGGDTLLAGPVVDQAALYGLLRKVRDLGLPLLSVHRVESKAESEVESESKDVTDDQA